MVIGAKRNPARPIPAAAMMLLHKVKINACFNFFYFQLQTDTLPPAENPDHIR